VWSKYRGRLRSAFGPLTKATLRGSAWEAVVQTVVKASVLLTLALSTRILSLEDFGSLVILQSLAFVMPAIWDLGYSGALVAEVAAGRASARAAMASAYRERLWGSVLYVSGWIVAGFLVVDSEEELLALLLFAVAGAGTAMSLLWLGLLQSALRFRERTIATGIGRFAPVIFLTALLLAGTNSLPLVAASFMVGELLTALILYVKVRAVAPGLPDLEAGGSSEGRGLRWSTARHYTVNTVALVAYNKGDVFLVGLVAGTYAAANYAPASRIQDALAILPGVVAAAMLPAIGHRSRRPGAKAAIRRAQLMATGLGVGVTLPLALLVAVFAEPFVTSLLGSNLDGAVRPTQVIVLAPVIVALATPMFDILVATGRVRRLNVAYLAGLAFSVVGQLTLTKEYGATGAAVVAVLRDSLVAAIGLAYFRAWLRTEAANVPEVEADGVGQPSSRS
jgi:O-antigen/teichoic acid export membrane protein